jgi:hypothetical protein
LFSLVLGWHQRLLFSNVNLLHILVHIL